MATSTLVWVRAVKTGMWDMQQVCTRMYAPQIPTCTVYAQREGTVPESEHIKYANDPCEVVPEVCAFRSCARTECSCASVQNLMCLRHLNEPCVLHELVCA
jgi:hypothetical protein